MSDEADRFIKYLKMPQVKDQNRAATMEELIRAANDPHPCGEMLHAYRDSYAVPLAMKALQTQVQALVANGNTDYLPQTRADYEALLGAAHHRSPELEHDWSREKQHTGFINHPGGYPKLRVTQQRIGDPLAMARKHVVDLLVPAVGPHAAAVDREANEYLRRHAGCYVTNLMVAMAQDAAHAQTRATGMAMA